MYATFALARTRARFAKMTLRLWLASAVLIILAQVIRLNLVNSISNGDTVSAVDATNSDTFVEVAAWSNIGVYVIAAIAFLMWLHRIVRNNVALGAYEMRFSPASAVGWWFAPIANL